MYILTASELTDDSNSSFGIFLLKRNFAVEIRLLELSDFFFLLRSAGESIFLLFIRFLAAW